MSQYDAAARPLFGVFQAAPAGAPYQAKAARVPLDARNTAWNRSAERSAKFQPGPTKAPPPTATSPKWCGGHPRRGRRRAGPPPRQLSCAPRPSATMTTN